MKTSRSSPSVKHGVDDSAPPEVLDFDNIQPGMTVHRNNSDAVDDATVKNINVDGGWLETTDGRTWFRHDLDNSWVYFHVSTRHMTMLDVLEPNHGSTFYTHK
jgi:hypothetical protein